MKEKIAIVTNGGGMKCAYSAGVLCGLAEVHNLYNPDILVGSSGSAGTLACYLTGQYNSIKNIWTNLLATDKFISFKRIKKIMNLDYLINDVLTHLEPLQVNSILKSGSKIFIATTEYNTGKSRFFTNTDDILLCLRASKAIPIITNTKVIINNTQYIDGSISSPFNANIEKAVKEGAKNIIVIADDESLSFSVRVFWYIYSFFVNKELKKTLRMYCKKSTHKIALHNNINMLVIKPSRELKTNSLDINKEHLIDSFNLGYNDIKYNKKIKDFIS